jgi:hypothetical protein
MGLQHDRLPQIERDDPSAAKAIGLSFLPYYNLYWVIFNTMRLTDRINLQYRLRLSAPTGDLRLSLPCTLRTRERSSRSCCSSFLAVCDPSG